MLYCLELCLDRLVVGHAFRILAFCDSDNLLRHDELLLLHYLEVADYIDSRLRCNQCQLVEFLIFEELVGNLDDSFAAVELTCEVDADGDLVLYSLEVKDVESLYTFSAGMWSSTVPFSSALTTNSFLPIISVSKILRFTQDDISLSF